jgi:hypothetical protein
MDTDFALKGTLLDPRGRLTFWCAACLQADHLTKPVLSVFIGVHQWFI